MEREFPKNVKQIGNVCDEPKIYVEDYVDTYLNQLKKKAAAEPAAVILTGEILDMDGQEVVYIAGALKLWEIQVGGSEIKISEESWKQLEEEKEVFFSGQDTVGWCLIISGQPMGLVREINKIHGKYFGKENTVFIWRDAIDNEVKKVNKPVTYIYHVGQYLPDWHPWESYKDFFIGKKETNGVREIFAIQLPWIINTFGKIKSINTVSQRCTDLDIDFQDSIAASFTHENGNIGTFVADTVSRKATVCLEIIGEELHLFWNGTPESLKKYDFEKKELVNIKTYDEITHIDGYADNIIEDQYLDEIKNFLDAVKGESVPKYSLEKDRYTLSLIDEIEGKR